MWGRKAARLADDLAELRTKYNVLRRQYAQVQDERNAAQWEIKHLASSHADLVIRRTRERDTAVRELRDTEDQLGTARQRLEAFGHRQTVPDVLEQHDVHRKALADTLGEQKRHLNWDQLIQEAGRTCRAAGEWMTENARLRRELRLSERARASLDEQVVTLGAINDQLSRQAVDHAGNLAAVTP